MSGNNVLEETWSDRLKITPSNEPGYDYVMENVSDDGIEFIDSTGYIGYISPKSYCNVTKDAVITTLKNQLFENHCLNAYLKNNRLIFIE